MSKKTSPTIEEVMEMEEDLSGWCSYCKEVVNHGGVEPDAENYECEECGNRTVTGPHWLTIMGDVQ